MKTKFYLFFAGYKNNIRNKNINNCDFVKFKLYKQTNKHLYYYDYINYKFIRCLNDNIQAELVYKNQLCYLYNIDYRVLLDSKYFNYKNDYIYLYDKKYFIKLFDDLKSIYKNIFDIDKIAQQKEKLYILCKQHKTSKTGIKKLINYYMKSLHWSELDSVNHCIKLFNNGTIDTIKFINKS